MNVIIFGATGLVGHATLLELLNHPDINMVCSPQRRSQNIRHNKLHEVIQLQFDPDFVEGLSDEIKEKVDVIICALGTTIAKAGTSEKFRAIDFDLAFSTAKLAQKMDAKFLVVSAAGANSNSPIFYNRVKGELEEAIKNLNLKSWIIFHPSLLIGKRTEKRTAEGLGIKFYKTLKPLLPKNLKALFGTEIDQLAKKIVDVSVEKNNESRVIGPLEISA